MKVDYKFIPEYKTAEIKQKSDILSYAGRLLEIVGSRTLIVTLNNDDEPVVLECNGRLSNALDFHLDAF